MFKSKGWVVSRELWGRRYESVTTIGRGKGTREGESSKEKPNYHSTKRLRLELNVEILSKIDYK